MISSSHIGRFCVSRVEKIKLKVKTQAGLDSVHDGQENPQSSLKRVGFGVVKFREMENADV